MNRLLLGAIIGAALILGLGFRWVSQRSEVPAIAAKTALDGARPAPASTGPNSFSATFILENGDKVALDYVNERNFRFSSRNSTFQTYVLDGRIYLYAPADGAQPERAWLYGKIADLPARPAEPPAINLRPTTIPPAGVAAWGDIGALGDVAVASAGQFGIAIEATVADHSPLANAQWAIVTTLLPAMDMALCGDGVQAITQWWPAELTGAGHAIIATSAGVRLDGMIRPAKGSLALPGDFPIDVHPLARF